MKVTQKRIEKALKEMTKRRGVCLNQYLMSLERPEWTHERSQAARDAANYLSACDTHIATLSSELKTLADKEVAHAS